MQALVESLGADHVVDYNAQDFTDSGHQYDCILDNIENRNLSEVRRALRPSGTLICNSGTGDRIVVLASFIQAAGSDSFHHAATLPISIGAYPQRS
ncbi:MAG: zinc-binding dehydrogenase [Pirellulaceae bacterium]